MLFHSGRPSVPLPPATWACQPDRPVCLRITTRCCAFCGCTLPPVPVLVTCGMGGALPTLVVVYLPAATCLGPDVPVAACCRCTQGSTLPNIELNITWQPQTPRFVGVCEPRMPVVPSPLPETRVDWWRCSTERNFVTRPYPVIPWCRTGTPLLFGLPLNDQLRVRDGADPLGTFW